MAIPAPLIDRRTENDIAGQVQTLLAAYVPGWQEVNSRNGQPQGAGRALINIFARDAALIIQRINRAPEKNFLAFLDLIGAALLPPEPARVPLTFSLAAGSAGDAVVPAGTQAAAPPGNGESEPVTFETERELVVTSAILSSIWTRDPEKDQAAELSLVLAAPGSAGLPAFQGQRSLEHLLYVGNDDLLSYPRIEQLQLVVDLDIAPSLEPRAVQWETWDGARWKAVAAGSIDDGTAHLTRSGAITIAPFPQAPQKTVETLVSRWLRARLLTPITQSPDQQAGMVRADALPSINTITLRGEISRSGLPVEHAFANALPVETGQDFLPFGDEPRFGDTLYLAHAEAFAQAGAAVTLHVTLTDPAANGRSPKADGGATLTWEYWDGAAWAALGTSNAAGAVTGVIGDSTKAFTASAANLPVLSGEVRWTFPPKPQAPTDPKPPAPATVNGIESYWIRARLSRGNYGVEARYVPDNAAPGGFRFEPATFGPPSLGSLAVEYTVTKTAAPDAVLTTNDFETIAPGAPFAPFRSTQDTDPALYLGFTLPLNRPKLPNAPLSLYCLIADPRYGERSGPVWPERSRLTGHAGDEVVHIFEVANTTSLPVELAIAAFGTRWATSFNPAGLRLAPGASQEVFVHVSIPSDAPANAGDRGWLRLGAADDPGAAAIAEFATWSGAVVPASQPPKLAWEYWNGSGWRKLLVDDETDALTRSGQAVFLPPADFVPSAQFGATQYWVRAVWASGDYETLPKLRGVLLNTTTAIQTLTLKNEVLGSSNGGTGQVFRTTRSPVLSDPLLQVREPELPPAAERAALEAAAGDDAISTVAGAASRPREIWVRWRQAPDFYASGPRDRHYVLDHLTGEVRFGDGQNGMIPPAGAGNIRLARYQTGGGARGNRAAATIAQLKTTVPYVDKVINHEAASRGADAETMDALMARAPLAIRHRNRAVTVEDYQDLALQASTEVARARCVPLFDLAADPDATQRLPGAVSVVVVPRSTDAKPLPSLELLDRVRSYLDARRVATSDLVVVGPDYVRVDVEVQIALKSLDAAGTVEAAVTGALRKFLHPLTGGADGAGWDFGRQPHLSDVYALLEPIAGVDHVHALRLVSRPDRDGSNQTDRFLVYAGQITATLTFDPA